MVKITAKDLSERLTTNEKIILIDVRREADVKGSAHQIPGAVWKNPEQVKDWAKTLGPEKTVVYCVRGAAVSQSVAQALTEGGRDAVFLEGGIQAWQDGLLPLEANPIYPNRM